MSLYTKKGNMFQLKSNQFDVLLIGAASIIYTLLLEILQHVCTMQNRLHA